MSRLWLIFVFLLRTSLNIQLKNPLLYNGQLPQLNNIYFTKCAPQVTCDPFSKYRTINGSCNNLEHPQWGSSLTTFIRLSEPLYSDGDFKIRNQVDGTKLPGPRELQLTLFLGRSRDYPDDYNFHINQLGQWIAHDFTLMPPDLLTKPLDCCDYYPINENTPEECQAIIEIPPMDPVYSTMGKKCMHFKRIMTAAHNFQCDISPQIPLNQATPFIDASQLYGHTQAVADSIRAFDGGKLRSENINGQEFCPQRVRNSSLVCDQRDNVNVCFLGGDPRANQHLGITVYQTMFLRLHNVFVDRLHHLNPEWSDEELYQEARRYIVAINQIITYRDLLPALMGKEYTKKMGLDLHPWKPTIYDPTILPQLTVEFSTSGYRVSHNILPSRYNFLDENYNLKHSVNLNEWMSKSDPLIAKHNFDDLLRGMTQTPGRAPVPSYNFLISNFLHRFISNGNQDLLATDIQRGRDSGAPTYNTMREMCGLPRASSFYDLADVLSIEDVRKLESLYATVDDVDLHVGSLLEPLCPGAMVGYTARCIMADVFYRIRYGDRFFFDVQDQPGSFSREQLNALQMIHLGHVFCAGSDVNEIPIDVYRVLPPGFSTMKDCKTLLRELNFSLWKVAA